MAGTLFIICVPSEKYEDIISNKHVSEPKPVEIHENGRAQFIGSSSEEDIIYYPNKNSSRHSSLETFALSMDSDSLNDKDIISEMKSRFKKNKSVENIMDDHESRAKMFEELRDKGSMDSDKFQKIVKNRERIRENEEAIDKFMNHRPTNQKVLDENSPMEKVLREIIERMHVKNVSWEKVNCGNSFKIQFTIENGVRCDDIIHYLSEFGIGEKEGSSVVIVPCSLYREHHHHHHTSDDDQASTSSQSVIKETAWNKFIGTVRARMNVAKIVEAVKADASLTFDFIVLIIVASVLAAFGLVENSTLFLAASMLISPLMGPILAATFGAAIKDHKLQYWGLRNEIIGLVLCISVGFIFGVVNCSLDYLIGDEKTLKITTEMENRMTLHSVIVGIMIALPSGAAVAIAVLGENFGSLVGVAISASLLPPAVNTGLGWSYSAVNFIFKNLESFKRFHTFFDENYKMKHSNDEVIELLCMGGISLCVTLTNILCIYLMGIAFLKMKEVAPVAENQRQFWKHDIKIARDYNKTLNADEGRKLQNELAQFHENAVENFKGVGAELLRQNLYNSPHTWSPFNHHHRHIRTDAYKTSIRNMEILFKPMDKHHRQLGAVRSSSPDHKFSNPMFIPPRGSSNDYLKMSSAPLDVINEIPRVLKHETSVYFDDPEPQTSQQSSSSKKKFIVTPARDP